MRIAQGAIAGVLCIFAVASAVSAGKPQQLPGRGNLADRGPSNFNARERQALQSRSRLDVVTGQGNGSSNRSGQTQVGRGRQAGPQSGTGRVGQDSGRRSIFGQSSTRTARFDQRGSRTQSSKTQKRSGSRLGFFSRTSTENTEPGDDDAGDDDNGSPSRGNRQINPQDRRFLPKADRLLTKRLADIDHLRDIALANGNDRLLQKADELETLAREQYARRIDERGDDPTDGTPPSDPVDEFPTDSTEPSDPVDDFSTEPSEPMDDFPTESIGDEPVTDDPVSLSFEEVPTTVGTASTFSEPAFSEPMLSGPTLSAPAQFNTSTTTTGQASLQNYNQFPQQRRQPVYGYQYISGGQQTQPVAGRDFGRVTSEAARLDGRGYGTNVNGQARLDGRGYGTTISNGVRTQNTNGSAFQNAQQFPTARTAPYRRGMTYLNKGNVTSAPMALPPGQTFGTTTSEQGRTLRRDFGTTTQDTARTDGRSYGTTISSGVRNPSGF